MKWRCGSRQRTEDEPRLAEMKVNAEVCVKADVGDGDVSSRLPTQKTVLPVAVPDTWSAERKTILHLLQFVMTTALLTSREVKCVKKKKKSGQHLQHVC